MCRDSQDAHEAEAKLARAQSRIDELTASATDASRTHQAEVEEARAEVRRGKEALEQERTKPGPAGDALSQLQLQCDAEAALHLRHVASLQAQLRDAEAARDALERQAAQPPAPRPALGLGDVQGAAESVIASLGLDAWRDERLGARGKRGSDAGGLRQLEEGRGAAKGRAGVAEKGHISMRMWLLIAYAAALHLCVMVQFTRHSASQCGSLGGGAVGAPVHLRAHALPS